jgi:hypothetical protein
MLRMVRYAVVGILTLLAYLGAGHALSKFALLPMSYVAPIAFFKCGPD